MKLQFIKATSLLVEACIPQPPTVLWKHPKENFTLEAGGIQIISSDDSKKSVRLSVQIAGEIARTKKPMSPTRGVNPYTGVNESEEYDAMLQAEARNMKVIYLNTLTTDVQVEAALIQTLPAMDRWLWTERDKGGEFPYKDLSLHIVNVRSGTIMKDDERDELRQFVRQNKIDVIVLNSFEFACRTQREKDDMVDLLKMLRDEYCVSILVFTHEPEKRLAAGASRRGPLGSLSILANCVSTIEKLAPELYVPGVCELEEGEKHEGYDGQKTTYVPAEAVQQVLHDAPRSALPRQHVRDDGTITSERFELVQNEGSRAVLKK